MKNNLLFILFVIISLTVVGWVFLGKSKPTSLISPETFTKKSPQPTQTPFPTAQPFQYHKDTNLEYELNSINPQTQDSDFTELESLTP